MFKPCIHHISTLSARILSNFLLIGIWSSRASFETVEV